MRSVRLAAAIACSIGIALSARVSAGPGRVDTPPPERRARIGLVLSGGGAKGFAHIGALKVLEEAGVRVDYITGTSMGSVVGALYAIGYDAKALERLALDTDWNDLLSDTVSRRYYSIDEKNEDGKYILSLPLHDGGIGLPRGLIAGQKTMLLLARLMARYHHVRDFRQLPIPFRCVATDIENGKPIVLERGFLPEAVRASMSLPTAFNPVELDGRLLVDGGVVRNFPVSDAREMGADIVIGIDTGAPLYSKKEIDSIAKIMEQSVSFLGDISTKEEQKLCDILIQPAIREYNATSFSDAATLIARGEEAARRFLPQLAAIAADQRRHGIDPRPAASPALTGPIRISGITVTGLTNVSRSLLMGKLDIATPADITIDEIDEAMNRAYGSHFFEQIYYRLEPGQDGRVLAVTVNENATSLLKLGIHYDTDIKAALLLNATFRNMLGQGSKLMFDARLGQNPALIASYFIHSDFKPGIGFGVDVWFDQVDVDITDNQNTVIASLVYSDYGGTVKFQTIFSNTFALGLAAEKQYTDIQKKIAHYDPGVTYFQFTNYFAFCKVDLLDRTTYPRSGFALYGEAKLITDDLATKKDMNVSNYERYIARLDCFLPVHDRVSLLGACHWGLIRPYQADTAPVPYPLLFYIGGLYTYQESLFPFYGYRFMEVMWREALVFQYGIQIEPRRDTFVRLIANTAQTTSNAEEVPLQKDAHLSGYGVSIGLLTPIGPIEITVMQSLQTHSVILHFNLGYRF
ncbi:MAG TPA: patatin-like phospholipase family protein [Spirochaetota bacterium]|nr:patatin-like phospholipase family protein [Spirochaetota bacterium]